MLGVIGGTGLYKLDGLKVLEEVQVETPFGVPSAPLIIGELNSKQLIFLARHGLQHEFLPSEINYRANIWALKSAGVSYVVGVSAAGSLKQEIAPSALIVPDQYIDLTKGIRKGSYFGNGLSAHIMSADPVCGKLAGTIAEAARQAKTSLNVGGTYVCVEGPRLGTRAESHMLRTLGGDLVGMTNVPEAFLALEAQLPYATIALITDYDCWNETPEATADIGQILASFSKNIGKAQKIIEQLIALDFDVSSSPSRNALEHALLVDPNELSDPHKSTWKFLKS